MRYLSPDYWDDKSRAPFPWAGVAITVLLLLAFITAGALLATIN